MKGDRKKHDWVGVSSNASIKWLPSPIFPGLMRCHRAHLDVVTNTGRHDDEAFVPAKAQASAPSWTRHTRLRGSDLVPLQHQVGHDGEDEGS